MNKLTFPACLLIFLCLTMIGVTLVKAQATVGVSKGDEFKYITYVNFNSDFLEAPPADAVETNQTQWVTVNVTDVSGSKISVHKVTQFKNGTQLIEDGFCDVDTGETNVAQVVFIGANLNIYDTINPSAAEPYYVNATIFRDYSGGQRETNLLEFDETGESDQVGTYTRMTQFYFDKTTGVLVELLYDFQYSGLRNTLHFILVSSNAWAIPEFPAWIILPLFVIVALAAFAIKKKTFKSNMYRSCSV
jgi:hypothetical protein